MRGPWQPGSNLRSLQPFGVLTMYMGTNETELMDVNGWKLEVEAGFGGVVQVTRGLALH